MTTPLGKYMVAMRPDASRSGKTKVWPIFSVRGPKLGAVSWLGRWRCYTFTPEPGTTFNADCMRSLAEFCESQTKEHKA